MCTARSRRPSRELTRRKMRERHFRFPLLMATLGAMREEDDNRGENDTSGRGGYVGFIDWLNAKLLPVLGPPPAGPYDTVVKQVGDALCPVCGRPMSEHTIDHSTPNTILNCPVEHKPDPFDVEPVNELGMDYPYTES